MKSKYPKRLVSGGVHGEKLLIRQRPRRRKLRGWRNRLVVHHPVATYGAAGSNKRMAPKFLVCFTRKAIAEQLATIVIGRRLCSQVKLVAERASEKCCIKDVSRPSPGSTSRSQVCTAEHEVTSFWKPQAGGKGDGSHRNKFGEPVEELDSVNRVSKTVSCGRFFSFNSS